MTKLKFRQEQEEQFRVYGLEKGLGVRNRRPPGIGCRYQAGREPKGGERQRVCKIEPPFVSNIINVHGLSIWCVHL